MANRIDEFSEDSLHHLIDTKDNTHSFFRHQLSSMNDTDKSYYLDFLVRKFNEHSVDEMIEFHFKDAFEDFRNIQQETFSIDEKSREEIYNRNDKFLNSKREHLLQIKGTLEELQKNELIKNLRSSTDIYSYNWIHKSENSGIKKLYDLLMNTKPEIISHKTDFEIFKKAFSNILLTKENELKIALCIIAPNGYTSKQSLFYFINQLYEKKFIAFSKHNSIPYIFVNKDGSEMKNIDESTSTPTKKPTRKKDIDNLIQSLQKDLN